MEGDVAASEMKCSAHGEPIAETCVVPFNIEGA